MAVGNSSTVTSGSTDKGDIDWVNYVDNWRAEDSEWLQERSVVRIDGDSPASVLVDNLLGDHVGRVYYSTTKSGLVFTTAVSPSPVHKTVLSSSALQLFDSSSTTSSLAYSGVGSPSITFSNGDIVVSKGTVTSLVSTTSSISSLTVTGTTSLKAGSGALAGSASGLTLNTTSTSSNEVILSTSSAGLSIDKGFTASSVSSNGTLAVTNMSTLSGGLTVSGGSGLSVTGPSSLTGSLSITGTIGVSGAAALSGGLTVSGGSGLSVTGPSSLTGSLSITGTIGVSGAAALSGGLTVSGGSGTTVQTFSATSTSTAAAITATNSSSGPNLRLVNSSPVSFDLTGSGSTPPNMSPSSGTWAAGDIIRDNAQNLWYCKTSGSGTSSKWSRMSGTGLNFLRVPRRAYNSSLSGGTFTLTSTVSDRTIPLSGIIPAGSTGALVNITLFSCVGNGHFLLVAGDVATPSTLETSSINWYTNTGVGMIIVNETSTPVDSSQNIKILAPASPGASTHFIIDVIGFYY